LIRKRKKKGKAKRKSNILLKTRHLKSFPLFAGDRQIAARTG